MNIYTYFWNYNFLDCNQKSVKVNAACENCLDRTAELIEKQTRESGLLIVLLKTIADIKGEKSSCEKIFANRTQFFDRVRSFLVLASTLLKFSLTNIKSTISVFVSTFDHLKQVIHI